MRTTPPTRADELDAATGHFAALAEEAGLVPRGLLPDAIWAILDPYVRRLTGRDPERLSPRAWIALAATLRDARRLGTGRSPFDARLSGLIDWARSGVEAAATDEDAERWQRVLDELETLR